jgi:hypothetical protein
MNSPSGEDGGSITGYFLCTTLVDVSMKV